VTRRSGAEVARRRSGAKDRHRAAVSVTDST
jgi:hypothetical protein